MRKRITYEIREQIERSCFFKIGKALLRVEFTGGSINSAGMIPASFVTDNPLYQKVIEESELFRNGEITIGYSESFSEEEASDKLSDRKDDEKKVSIINADVTNMQQARSLLMSEPYNISLSELQNKAAVREKALKCGVSFPNWV